MDPLLEPITAIPEDSFIRAERRAKEFYQSVQMSDKPISDEEFDEIKAMQTETLRQATLKYFYAKSRPQLTPYTFTAVAISHVESHFEFYVVKKCDVEWRNECQRRLNHLFESFAEPIIKPEQKFVCAVQDNAVWYRGLITKIEKIKDKEQFHVLLIDFGRIVCKDRKYLAVLPVFCEKIPPLAIKCSLTIMHKDHMRFCDDEKILFELLTRFQEVISGIDGGLVYWNAPEHINDIKDYAVGLLIDVDQTQQNAFGGAYVLNEAYGVFDRNKIQFSNPIFKNWINRPIKMWDLEMITFGQRTSVKIAYAVSPAEIYVQYSYNWLKDLKTIRYEIDEHVTRHINQYFDENRWTAGDLCLVRAQHPQSTSIMKIWFRGRIIAVNGTIKVFVRDFGNTVSTTHIDLLPISNQLAKYPDLAIKCYLSGCEDLNCYVSKNALYGVIDLYKFYAIKIVDEKDNAFGVTLCGSEIDPSSKKPIEWQNINTRVMSELTIQFMQEFIRLTQYSYNHRKFGHNLFKLFDDWSPFDDTNENNIASASSSEQNGVRRVRIVSRWLRAEPAPNNEHTFEGKVVWMDHCGVFYIQSLEQMKDCSDLAERITDYLEENTQNFEDTRRHEWKVGEACLAAYYRDDLFYRATILSIDYDQCICTIEFVDYGQRTDCQMNDLRVATKFGNIPSLVNRYYMPEIIVQNPSGEWLGKIYEQCLAEIEGQFVEVDVIATPYVRNIVPCAIRSFRIGYIIKWMLRTKLATNVSGNPDGDLCLHV